jgi:hypothetical protein
MLGISIKDNELSVKFPHIWRAEDSRDYTKIALLLDSGTFRTLYIDLGAVNVLNVATIWLIDQIQWKCVEKSVSFNVVGSTKIVKTYFEILPFLAQANSD